MNIRNFYYDSITVKVKDSNGKRVDNRKVVYAFRNCAGPDRGVWRSTRKGVVHQYPTEPMYYYFEELATFSKEHPDWKISVCLIGIPEDPLPTTDPEMRYRFDDVWKNGVLIRNGFECDYARPLHINI